MTLMVVGGAGYIGSHVVRNLHAEGRPIVVLDDLSTGIAARLPHDVPLVVASCADRFAVAQTLRGHRVTAVVHLAARKSAPESFSQPLRYYRDNTDAIRVLLEEMVDAEVSRMLLSSSAAVYGIPPETLVFENAPTVPINPYGETKLASEWMVRAVGAAHGMSWIALRYFNVIGADSPIRADRAGNNLLSTVFRSITAGKPAVITGSDFPTRDGTGIRDYVHVTDVAEAHAAAVRRLDNQGAADIYNVGTGRGCSVLEVLDAVSATTGESVRRTFVPPRPGDPAEVVAGVEKISKEISWKAGHDLGGMVTDAWKAWSTESFPPGSEIKKGVDA